MLRNEGVENHLNHIQTFNIFYHKIEFVELVFQGIKRTSVSINSVLKLLNSENKIWRTSS